MSLIRRVTTWLAGLGRALGRGVADTIRWGAEPNAIARSIGQEGPHDVPPSVGGAMIAGAGRRIGEAEAQSEADAQSPHGSGQIEPTER